MAGTTGSSDPGSPPGSAHRHRDGEANPGPQVGPPQDQPRGDSDPGPADLDAEANAQEVSGNANPGPPKEPLTPA